ncbi:hypothetical protein [Falsiroseomonas sp.]|uniref:hypothetical protein n=1 Tax=Falsiroseomonas sp. TaxID=2870721 RepID=UPI003562101B
MMILPASAVGMRREDAADARLFTRFRSEEDTKYAETATRKLASSGSNGRERQAMPAT